MQKLKQLLIASIAIPAAFVILLVVGLCWVFGIKSEKVISLDDFPNRWDENDGRAAYLNQNKVQ